jgi:hypothetical protein
VTIAVRSNDESEGTVAPELLTFTPDSWDVAQSVTVTGADDKVDDGDVTYGITLGPADSTDDAYDGLDPGDLTLANVDDDTAGITVSEIRGDTTEAGQEAAFTVVLDSRPLADVVISMASSDATEGMSSPASLTFTPDNWETPQTVGVVGVDDLVDDGDVGYSIFFQAVLSSDALYADMSVADVPVTNLDDDQAGVNVSAIDGNTSESGLSAGFSLSLHSQPTGVVRIDLMSSDASEGLVAADHVLFTPATWNTPQYVTVTGVGDFIDDGDVEYMVVTAVSSDEDQIYDGIHAGNVPIYNLDDDTAAIFVSSISGDTSEMGSEATFSIVLGSEPTADVTIALDSSDPTEGNLDISSLTFTAGDWDVPQTVTVAGVDDALDDGDIAFQVLIAPAVSLDAGYDGMESAPVAVTNLDDPWDGLTWQNSTHPYDVNADGNITPQDILLLVDYLNKNGSMQLPMPPSPGKEPPPYLDPSGDNEITPFDILLVLSYLNEFGPGPAVPSASAPAGNEGASGSPSAALGEGEAAPWRQIPILATPQRLGASAGVPAESHFLPVADVDALNSDRSTLFGSTVDLELPAETAMLAASREQRQPLNSLDLEDTLADIADDVNRCWASPTD